MKLPKLRGLIYGTVLYFGAASLVLGDGSTSFPQALLALANTWVQTQQIGASGQGYVTINPGGGAVPGYVGIFSTGNTRLGFFGYQNSALGINADGTNPISFYGSGGTVLMGQMTNNGMVLPKLSAAPSTAPGVAKLDLFAVAGTNAGTCKLQAVVGTSTTPVTVVDNIGAGC